MDIHFDVKYTLLNKVGHSNNKVYFEIEIHRTKEFSSVDKIAENDIEEFEIKWFELD